jgi:subtilase family serine protease
VIISKVESWVNREEGMYTVSYVVQNQGAVTALKGHNTTLYIDDEPREHKLVPVDLGPCEEYHDTFDTIVQCSPPRDEVRVCADNSEKVAEANEKNNCVTNIWTCEVV